MKTIKILMLGTAVAAASLTAANAANPMVSEIDVSVEFASTDANVLQFYPTLEVDLEAKLAETLKPVMSDTGGRIQVILSDVSVDGSEILGSTGEFNTMSGGMFFYPVNLDKSDSASAVNPMTSTINVVAVPEYPANISPDGPTFIMPPSEGSIYDAMIEKFSEVVAERLNEM
jgi:hypothetical protein